MLIAYLLSFSLVALWAAYNASLHCEGFGCSGVGIVWLAWAALFAVALLIGAIAHLRSASGSGQRRLTRYMLLAQGLAGLFMLVYWLRHT
jgi:hypothetical protein